MSNERLWYTLRTGWWVVVIGAALGALLALFALQVTPKQYESTSRVLVQPTAVGQRTDVLTNRTVTEQTDQTVIEQMLPTYIALAGSDGSLDATSQRLGGTPTSQTLRQKLEYVADEDSPTIVVTGHAATPAAAAAMADAGAETVAQVVQDGFSGDRAVTTQIIEKAAAPSSASAPNPQIFLPVGVITGALVAFLVLLVRTARGPLPRSLRTMETAVGAPVLGLLRSSSPSLTRQAEAAGLPTTLSGIRRSLYHLDHRMVALVDVGTTAADEIVHGSRHDQVASTSVTPPEIWQVPLSDRIATLPDDAVVVLVIDESCSHAQATQAARFSTAQGIEVIGCIVVATPETEPPEASAGTETNAWDAAELSSTSPRRATRSAAPTDDDPRHEKSEDLNATATRGKTR